MKPQPLPHRLRSLLTRHNLLHAGLFVDGVFTFFFVLHILPRFGDVFDQLEGLELPLITEIFLSPFFRVSLFLGLVLLLGAIILHGWHAWEFRRTLTIAITMQVLLVVVTIVAMFLPMEVLGR